MPVQKSVYGGSRKADHSENPPDVTLLLFFLSSGVNRGFTSASMAAALNSTMNPMTLTVQPYPILGISRCAISGNTIPPVVVPLAAIAIARARRLEKYVGTFATVGQKTSPSPNPLHNPCVNSNCQYVLDTDAVMIARIFKVLPAITACRR